MIQNPLQHPGEDATASRIFCAHFDLDAERLRRGEDDVASLETVAKAISRIPYENLTKIINWASSGRTVAKRLPLDVISAHVEQGAGGTCFSLTAALLHILRFLGWRAEPILADRHYGQNTHCALVVWVGDGTPHLLDPGYLIVKPIPLENGSLERGEELHVPTSFNDVILSPVEGGEKIELHTLQQGQRSHRLTFKAGPADPAEFLKAWDASFDWDMMRYPVLTRADDEKQVYLQGQRLQVRGRESLAREEIPREGLPLHIARVFGVDARVVERALGILSQRGELDGAATAS